MAIIYPFAAAWVWGDGWLERMGFVDLGGAGVVHMVGGVCALVGSLIAGPRTGYFDNRFKRKKDKPEKSQKKKSQVKIVKK